jgi:hypothetical protein
MNAGGWLVMLLSVGGMTTFFALCVKKVLFTPGSTDHLHSQKDRTPDEGENGPGA